MKPDTVIACTGSTTSSAEVVIDLLERVWSRGDVTAVTELVAPNYTIYHDPGDPWEGRTLGHEEFTRRLLVSRAPFPDQRFTIDQCIADGRRVAVRWRIDATHRGDLGHIPATGRRVTVTGATIYEVIDGLATGHWQEVDRAGLYRQLTS